jgi:hypothetical protein
VLGRFRVSHVDKLGEHKAPPSIHPLSRQVNPAPLWLNIGFPPRAYFSAKNASKHKMMFEPKWGWVKG